MRSFAGAETTRRDKQAEIELVEFEVVGHQVSGGQGGLGVLQAGVGLGGVAGWNGAGVAVGEHERVLKVDGADVEHVDRMASLAARADQGTWWAPFGEVLPNWFKTFVGLEGLATSEFTYGSLLAARTAPDTDYAAALLVGNLRVPPMDAPQVVRARMARQRLTDDTSPLRFRAVIEEYVLDRIVGGSHVMRAQLEHLLALMRHDSVELHLMPALRRRAVGVRLRRRHRRAHRDFENEFGGLR